MRALTNDAVIKVVAAAVGGLVTVGAVYYLAKKAGSAITDSAVGKTAGAVWDAGNSVADVVTTPIANLWVKLGALVNNSNVEFSRAEIYLNPKYFDASFKINAAWMNAMSAGHSDIAGLFKQLLDSTGRVKTQYRHLIGGALNQKVLG